MRNRLTRRVAAAAGAGISITLLLAACGADEIDGSGSEAAGDASGDAGAASGVDPAAEIDCAPYEQFEGIEGTEVSLYTSIIAPEDQPYIDAFTPFEECTGVDVTYEGSSEFEAQLLVRTQAGNPPDIALFPQPGLLQTIVRDTGAVVPAPDAVEAAVDEYYGEDWKGYGTVDGEFYAAPNSANVKSFVWYSPSMFEEAGYEIPQTWEEMVALSEQIVADNPGGEVKPWCAGIGSGDATGWPTTDWMEDVMLRLNGPDVYDQWVNHEIPFNDPAVAATLERSAASSRTRTSSTAASAACSPSPPPRSRTAACRSSMATASCTVRPRSTRPTGPTAPRWPRTATCSLSTCRRSPRTSVARSWVAVSSSARSPTSRRCRRSSCT